MFYIWFIFSILLIFYTTTQYIRTKRLQSKLPGPTPYPFIGNILFFMNLDRHQLWLKFSQLSRKYYPIFQFWIFKKPIVIVYHPDDLKILLSSQKAIEKGLFYKYLQPWLQTGLLTSSGEKWQHRRRMLTPAFHFWILKKYMEIVTEQAEKMIESLEKEGSETVKDIVPFFSDYTLNIICESTMGVVLDAMEPRELLQYKKSVHDMGDVFVYRIFRPYLVNSIFPYVPIMGSLQKKALKTLHSFTNKVIRERREYHKNEGDNFLKHCDESSGNLEYNDSGKGTTKRLAMLDLLLAAEKRALIDNEGIKEEVDTFVLEGHDVTSVALAFTVLLLAENKEAQDRARDEVTTIMDIEDGKVQTTAIQEFPYLERCIKESLRLFPPISIMQRCIREDLQLKNALVPANTDIIINIWQLHRDPNFWPDPTKFDPDRFLPKNMKDRHPFCYIPFSAGSRNCIGQKFAMMELKSILSYILYNFYLEPVDRTDDIPLVVDLLIRPRDSTHVKFVKINK